MLPLGKLSTRDRQILDGMKAGLHAPHLNSHLIVPHACCLHLSRP